MTLKARSTRRKRKKIISGAFGTRFSEGRKFSQRNHQSKTATFQDCRSEIATIR